MVATVAARNSLAASYGVLAAYSALTSALTLQAGVSTGGTSLSVDLSVAIGDILVIDNGQAGSETRTVTAVSGSGPYTVTVAALTNNHSSGALISHIPLTSATLHEIAGGSPAYARIVNSWGSPANGAVVGGQVTHNVPISAKVGAWVGMSALTAGTYYDAVAVVPQVFASQGTYSSTPTYNQT